MEDCGRAAVARAAFARDRRLGLSAPDSLGCSPRELLETDMRSLERKVRFP
jgi:hypothetical protein